MILNMKTLSHTFLFYFSNEYMALVETKDSNGGLLWSVVDLKVNSSKGLVFQSMGEELVKGNKIQVRKFTNAELRFDDNFAKFILNDEAHLLERLDILAIPEAIHKIISQS